MPHRAPLLLTAVLFSTTAWIVLPYAQRTANSHVDAGPLLGALYVVAASIVAVYATRARHAWWCVVGVCLGSALRLSTLDCLVCLHSG